MKWYTLNENQLFDLFGSSKSGLNDTQYKKNKEKYGSNELPLKKNSIWKVILEPFWNVFVAVLLVAALVSFLSHEIVDGIIVVVIIVVSALIFYVQHYTTSRVIRSLKKHTIQEVKVIRQGAEKSIKSTLLVPGDIVLLYEGERVPADIRLIEVNNITIDESSLTGESIPVQKHASVLTKTKQVYEQDNMAFQGSYVLAGTAVGLVVSVGGETEFGKIASLSSTDEEKSPVQAKIDSLISNLVKVVLVMSAVVFVLSLVRGIESREALQFVLSLTVSAVPEGLPVALTIIVVLGMKRMAKNKALVRGLRTIEDIGLVTTIATDKTGTLTQNKLSVVDSWPLGKADIKSSIIKTIDAKANQADPLDKAISEMGKSNNDEVNKVYPFDLGLRMSGVFYSNLGKVYIKGSPEALLERSRLSDEDKSKIESKLHYFASQGYRVISVATYESKKAPENLNFKKDQHFEFIGLVAFADKLRSEVKGAIKYAKEAGIKVKLITGDHYETAFNIAKQVGLAEHQDQVMQGKDLPNDAKELALAVDKKTVFSRILPEDKFRILKALKGSEITAMTGDGVNDVPALTNAHVGIAMGSGSDIAKDAGGVVLLDDNFATIIKAVSEGRRIFSNIQKMLFYLLSTSMGQVATMTGALLVGLPLPVTSIQILWVNLVTDTALVIPLGLEPEEDGLMNRPPRKPKAPLLSRLLLSRMALVSLTMAAVTLSIVFVLDNNSHSKDYIQTVAFMALVVAQWVNAFNARSELKSSFSRLRTQNISMIVGLIIAVTLQVLVMFGPLSDAFGVVDVPINTLLLACGVMSVSILAVSELHKLFCRIRSV